SGQQERRERCLNMKSKPFAMAIQTTLHKSAICTCSAMVTSQGKGNVPALIFLNTRLVLRVLRSLSLGIRLGGALYGPVTIMLRHRHQTLLIVPGPIRPSLFSAIEN